MKDKQKKLFTGHDLSFRALGIKTTILAELKNLTSHKIHTKWKGVTVILDLRREIF
jgi:hypothetical protein